MLDMKEIDLTEADLRQKLANLLATWLRAMATERLSLAAEHARRIAQAEFQLERLSKREIAS